MKFNKQQKEIMNNKVGHAAYGVLKKRSKMINKSFEHLNKSLNEHQMAKRFGKEGW